MSSSLVRRGLEVDLELNRLVDVLGEIPPLRPEVNGIRVLLGLVVAEHVLGVRLARRVVRLKAARREKGVSLASPRPRLRVRFLLKRVFVRSCSYLGTQNLPRRVQVLLWPVLEKGDCRRRGESVMRAVSLGLSACPYLSLSLSGEQGVGGRMPRIPRGVSRGTTPSACARVRVNSPSFGVSSPFSSMVFLSVFSSILSRHYKKVCPPSYGPLCSARSIKKVAFGV